jgi:hypothetical protein
MSDVSVERELKQVVCELMLCSHVSAAQPGSSSRDASEGIGGKRPPGGIDRKDDREHEWPLKSAGHFIARINNAHSERTLILILAEAKASLEAFERQPKPTKQNEPEVSSPQWKRYIAESTEGHGTLAGRFGVSRAYIQQIRKRYGDAREVDRAVA